MPPFADLLGAMIESTRLHGEVFCQTEARPPWGVTFAARPEAMFHLVTAGSALALVGATTHVLGQGDLLLFARGGAHALVDHPRSKRITLADWLAASDPAAVTMRLGGARGPETRVLCGVYTFDGLGAQHPVLRVLPPFLHVSAARAREHEGLAETLTALAREHERRERGSSVVIARLLDVLFVQIVRAWAAGSPPGVAGWIGALTDTVLARALAAIHSDLAYAWTVPALARAAGASRATLGRRFVAAIGEPPLAYVTRARMQEASRLLTVGDDGLAVVAARVGYESEFAFNRVFKRLFGAPPGEYRRRLR